MTAPGPTLDPSLPLPPVPDLERGLGDISFPLEPPEGAPPAVLGADARMAAAGTGLALTDASGALLVERLGPRGAEVEITRVTPIGLERELRWPHGTVLETTVVPFSGAVALVEWKGERTPVPLEWLVPAPETSEPIRWRADDRAMVVVRDGRSLLFVLSAPGAYRVEATPSGGLHVRADATEHRVLLAIGRLRRGEPHLPPALRRPELAVRTREGRVRRLLEDRLAVEAPHVPDAARAAWGLVALSAWETGGGGLEDWAAAAAAEASLATGGASAIRGALATAFERQAPPPIPALAVFARYVAWTGDRSVAAMWDRVVEAASRAAGGPRDPRTDAVLIELGRVAEDLGRPAPDSWPRRRDGEGEGDVLPRLLLDAAAAPRGPGGAPSPRLAGTVAPVLRLVDRLGVAPDAPRGRLVWRPVVDDRGRPIRVRGLRVGTAVADLGLSREGSTIRFELGQSRGTPPLQVVLEPVVAAGQVVETRVDGAAASLKVRPVVGRAGFWRVPVQLVLDGTRSLEVELAPENH